jgi:hypothetical protein
MHILGKASGLDHNWQDHIDHHKPELSACCLAMYVNCNLTGKIGQYAQPLYFRSANGKQGNLSSKKKNLKP